MKDYVRAFQDKIKEIDKESRAVYIINAGVMNNGKSSLFNSLMDKERFAEQDIRTTIKGDEEQWEDGVYLVDTPGLNAEEADNAEAYAAYRRANMIVFCHTANVGELRAAELAAINRMKKLFGSEEDFLKHFCLVITFLDSSNPESVELIKDKSLSDINKTCGGKDFPTFLVSNPRYRKGRDENKPAMVKKSGIPEFRDFLKGQTKRWLSENASLRLARIRREKDDLLTELNEEKNKISKAMQSKEKKIKDRQKAFLNKLETAVHEREDGENSLHEKKSRLAQMQNELSDLRRRHENERY